MAGSELDHTQGVIDKPQLHSVHLNLTAGCNLNCSFCYAKAVRGRAEILPFDVIAHLIEDCIELKAHRIILSGGEPLSRKDWGDIAQLINDANIEVSIATNGTLITKQVAEFLSRLQRVLISISIDGDEEMHDRIRGQKGAYQRTVQGLGYLQEAGIEFDTNATIMKSNLQEIAALTKFSRDFQCTMRLTLIHLNGRGESLSDQVLDLDQILRLREYCHQLRQDGIKIYLNLPPLLQYLGEIIPNRGTACGWATNFCGVLANGDVSICGVAIGEPALVAGNLHNQSFKEIWLHSDLFRHTRSLKVEEIRGVCGRCPFNEYCGGACRLSAFRVYGDLSAPYELCQRFYEAGYISKELLS